MANNSPKPNLYIKYHNKSGSRWSTYIDSRCRFKERVLVRLESCLPFKFYTIQYWEAIGNYAVPYIRVKGKYIPCKMSMCARCIIPNLPKV